MKAEAWAEAGETLSVRPGTLAARVLGIGLGGESGAEAASLPGSCLPLPLKRPTGPPGGEPSESCSGSMALRFLADFMMKKMRAPIRAMPPTTPTTAPTMTGVLAPLELDVSVLPVELPDPLLSESPLPFPFPLPLPVPVPLPPVAWAPSAARLPGYDCSTELEMPAAVTCAAAALQ